MILLLLYSVIKLSNADCEKVYCANITSGANNILYKFFSLVRFAHNDSACICMPMVACSYPLPRDRPQKMKRLNESAVLDLGDWGHPLPPFSDNKVTKWFKMELWAVHTEYWETMRNEYADGLAPNRHFLEAPFYKAVLKPDAQISSIINGLPKQYVAIHARVENDMRAEKHWRKYGRKLFDIFKMINDQIGKTTDLETDMSYKSVLIALGRDLAEVDKRSLAVGPPWGGKVISMDKTGFDYLDSAFVDLFSSVKASRFFGTAISTFSMVVSFVRDDPQTTFFYHSGSLVQNKDRGLCPVMGCECVSYDNWVKNNCGD